MSPAVLPAASMAELAELSRKSTFEVVLPKIESAQVTYEKPLPLELLSYTERNDKYWSIGTAFAIAPDVFVSNAHVLIAGMGSAMGHPHLRDAAGQVYAVDRVLKFSLHEDFVVFRAKGANAAQALTPGRETPIGARVFAVGNALGEGVVLRDGLLTSLTPEDQDGRWKWLRFSAAASPGNSGGPLLDEHGQVIGVVTARSEGENLNYALPIERVLAGSERRANIDLRSSFGLPILRQQMVMEFKDEFSLPASWEDFGRHLFAAIDRQYATNQQRLLQQYAQELPPGGKADRLLAGMERDKALALIGQQSDDNWGLTDPGNEELTELSDGSKLTTGNLQGALTFKWWRPGAAADPSLYSDASAFMDTLLKGIKLPRMIGPQAIRITSLGAPQEGTLHTDRFGRTWQLRSWSLGYADMQLVTMALPVPNGYRGLMQFTTAVGHSSVTAGLKLMADYMHVSYEGSAAQWR
ncbi:MAG TPA: serine protease, partial [Steroidobacteraceae bacterium]|nr:serine protease [Steroidobacteraceae bacterium]